MDEIDRRIIAILRQDSRTSNRKIASEVNLTEGAIRNRIKRLIQSGVIKRFTILEEGSDRAEAIVLIRTQTKGAREALKKLRKYSNRLFETAGEYDAAAHLLAENMNFINEMVDKIRAIEGVLSTVTLLKIAGD